jgi:ABC-type uncharacterized transport system substrate-binding protein
MAGSTEDTSPKQFELLKAVMPNLSRVRILLNPESSDYSDVQTKMQAAAEKPASRWCGSTRATRRESTARLRSFASQRVEAVTITDDRYFFTQQKKLAERVLKYRLPSSIRGETTCRSAG